MTFTPSELHYFLNLLGLIYSEQGNLTYLCFPTVFVDRRGWGGGHDDAKAHCVRLPTSEGNVLYLESPHSRSILKLKSYEEYLFHLHVGVGWFCPPFIKIMASMKFDKLVLVYSLLLMDY